MTQFIQHFVAHAMLSEIPNSRRPLACHMIPLEFICVTSGLALRTYNSGIGMEAWAASAPNTVIVSPVMKMLEIKYKNTKKSSSFPVSRQNAGWFAPISAHSSGMVRKTPVTIVP